MRNDSQMASLKRRMRRKPVKVIAVCSGKGGVGKTNVAANLAIAFGARGRNTLLLDADLSLANVDVLLGLQPMFNLSHVVRGDVSLSSTIVRGPRSIRVVPAASGSFRMTDLSAAEQAAIIQSFSELEDQPEILIVDTAPGIHADVARFAQAAQIPIITLCDEPASLTDAYALIKVFSQNYGITHFHVTTNLSRRPGHGRALFRKLLRVTDAYLDVVLRHSGDIPHDELLRQAVQEQRAVVDAYPTSPSAVAFNTMAATLDALPSGRDSHGGIEFFFERMLLAGSESRGKVA